MPKEIIKDQSGPFEIKVTWSRGSWAQIATVLPEGEERHFEAILEAWKEEGNSMSHGMVATLSPESIDQLIKVLKRVKKQITEV